jgi:hypothetical protein
MQKQTAGGRGAPARLVDFIFDSFGLSIRNAARNLERTSGLPAAIPNASSS